ncbi:hypothetical protein BAE44_0005183 [Dichanthelium oligosanthes]|uniref:Uncharacterized protein n=1 Tax=Dichanthelium oligosanthes TaxID=888268 RepID=A0A1E5W8W6_9POAL|nr:hypothetical protein BAE44_0005183 [Dichanthelium oligosanthes]
MVENGMNLPIDSHMSPRMPMLVSEQQMLEEIEAFLLLDTHQADHHSTPCPMPPMNYHHILANHEPTSHHPLSNNQNQMPEISPQFTGYYPYVRIPPPMPPIYVHSMPLPIPFLPQQLPPFMATTITPIPIVSGNVPPINYTPRGFRFSGNNTIIQNNIAASRVITPLQVPPGAQHNIFNTYCQMKMIASTSTYGVGGASASNIAAQGGGASFCCPYNNPPVNLQFSSIPPVVNSSSPRATSIILPDHILPKVEETISITHASVAANGNGSNDTDNAIDADAVDGQQQHQEQEPIASHDLNVVDGNFCAEVAAATSLGEDNYDIGWDEFEIAKFFEDIMIDDDPVPLPDTTSSTGNLLPLASDMPDLKGFGNEPCLSNNDIISSTRTKRRCD